MTSDQERNLKGLLDASIPECRAVREFFLNLHQYGVEVAKQRFVSHGIRNEEYWQHAVAYMRGIEDFRRIVQP